MTMISAHRNTVSAMTAKRRTDPDISQLIPASKARMPPRACAVAPTAAPAGSAKLAAAVGTTIHRKRQPKTSLQPMHSRGFAVSRGS